MQKTSPLTFVTKHYLAKQFMNFLSALSSAQFKTQQSTRESSIFYTLLVWGYPNVIRGLPCFIAHIDIRSKEMMKPLLSCINGRRIKNQKSLTAERFIIPTYTVLSSGFYLYIFLFLRIVQTILLG